MISGDTDWLNPSHGCRRSHRVCCSFGPGRDWGWGLCTCSRCCDRQGGVCTEEDAVVVLPDGGAVALDVAVVVVAVVVPVVGTTTALTENPESRMPRARRSGPLPRNVVVIDFGLARDFRTPG